MILPTAQSGALPIIRALAIRPALAVTCLRLDQFKLFNIKASSCRVHSPTILASAAQGPPPAVSPVITIRIAVIAGTARRWTYSAVFLIVMCGR